MYGLTYDVSFKEEMASNHGLLVVKRPDIPVPERKVETVTIAGRDGVLVSDVSRYEAIDIQITFNFMVKKREDWNEHLRMVKSWAQGSGRLSMSDDESYFYKVLYTKLTLVERTSYRIGLLTVDFICDPYQYRKEGGEVYSVEECRYNPYDVCHPAYIVEGVGTAVLTVNGRSVTMQITDKITIDADLMIAYDGDGNAVNTSTLGDFEGLYLQPGNNEIDITDGFALSIIPRWRHI